MIPISLNPDAEPGLFGQHEGSDFAARLKARLIWLRAHAEGRAALVDVIREANQSLDPRHVAGWLAREALQWIPAPCWAVVAHDAGGQLAVIGHEGFTPVLGPSLWSVTTWVMNHGVELWAADLADDKRASPGAAGTALGFPLICRNRTIGVLVGLDPAPSAAEPVIDRALLALLQDLLAPAAIALDNALALERAESLSVTDDLTRLYNSRYLHQVLRQETKRAARSGRPVSLLFLDLDGFKQVNDVHGHQAGSRALAEAGAVLRGCARETDVVARFGGDEFAVVLPDTGRDGALLVGTRVLERLRSFHFLEQSHLSVRLTASIGVATLPDVADSAEELLRAADVAMYRVKAAGKDGIHVARQADVLPDSPASDSRSN